MLHLARPCGSSRMSSSHWTQRRPPPAGMSSLMATTIYKAHRSLSLNALLCYARTEHKTPEGTSYFHHAGRGETIWTKPPEWEAIEANPPGAGGGATAAAAAPQQQQQQQAAAYEEAAYAQQQQEPYVDAPENWEECWDEGGACYFYYNHVTQETLWERPAILDQQAQDEYGYSTPVKPRGRELPSVGVLRNT